MKKKICIFPAKCYDCGKLILPLQRMFKSDDGFVTHCKTCGAKK